MRVTSRLFVLAWLVITIASTQAQAQTLAPWAGWARCQVDVQGPGYSDHQIHTWMLTGGAPTVEGAFRVYEGTWSVVGGGSLQRTQGSQTLTAQWATNVQGMRAPIAVFVRASDGRMLISARHAQLRSAGAIAGYQQQTIDGKPQSPGQIASEAFEWAFPAIDGASTSTSLTGSSSPAVNGSIGPMQPAGSRGTASCTWQFGQGAAAPAPPPTLTAQAVPTPGAVPSQPTGATTPNQTSTTPPNQTATTTPNQMTPTTPNQTATTSPNQPATTPNQTATTTPVQVTTTSPNQTTTVPNQTATTTPNQRTTTSPNQPATTPNQPATTTPVQMTTTTAVQSPNETAAPTASLVPAAIQTATLSGGGTQPAPSTQTGGSSLGNGTLTLAREWTGSATCQIDITTGENYIDQQIHTWTIKRGSTVTADGSYDATWTLSGHGFNAVASRDDYGFPTVNRDLWTYKADAWAPLAVVAASGGRLKIIAQHPQRVARGGATGVETYTWIDGNPLCYNQPPICQAGKTQNPAPDKSIDFVVAEFPFPAIEVPPIVEGANTGAHTSGTVSIPVNGPLTPWQPSNASGTASCSWDFHQEVAGH